MKLPATWPREDDMFRLSITANWSTIKCRLKKHHGPARTTCSWSHTIRTQADIHTTINILSKEWKSHIKEDHRRA